MTFEQMVGDALHVADAYEPSPDLFAKVKRSIDEDVAHRRRLRTTLIWIGLVALFVAGYLAMTVDVQAGGANMSFAALEVLVTLLMVGIVVVMGPAIRRFGELYERDVFRASPETGAAVLRLLDIAYYLIFGAFIVMTLVFDPTNWIDSGLAASARLEFERLAGLLLLMGLLHVGLLLALPIAGLVHAANERRLRISAGAMSTSRAADRVDRVITFAAWVIAGIVVIALIFAVLNFVLLGASV